MATSSRHAWEHYDSAWASAGYSAGTWDDSASENEEVSAEEAGERLADLLVRLRTGGVLSAKQACLIAHWAAGAGAAGPCRDFAVPPGQQSGQYARKMDRYLRLDADGPSFYMIDVPGQDKSQASRVVHRLEAVPAHEALAEELAADPDVLPRLQASVARRDWPQSYTEHPVVREAPPGSVLPLALYLDGVPFSKSDGFLAFWVYNLLTMQRHLVAVLRKSFACTCGCKRWCSLHPIFLFLRWTLSALARGEYPAGRHDGTPWRAEDAKRAEAAGRPLPRGVVVALKGDWAEFALTLGFPTWAHNAHPCLFCACTREQLFDFSGVSPVSFPYALRDAAGYDAACSAAERQVVIPDRGVHAALARALFYDKRADGARGRALTLDFPALGLARGDRLEPSATLRDVGDFEALAVFPVTVLFWCRRHQTWTTHRNPLFCAETGIGIHTIAIDTLHTLNLGLYQKFVARVWWTLLLNDAWGVAHAAGGRRNVDELVQNGVRRLRQDLFAWYDARARASPGSRFSRLADLTVKTLGDQHAVCVRTKAAETRPLVEFCVDLLGRFPEAVPADRSALLPAGRELARLIGVLRGSARVLRPSELQGMHDALKRYAVLSVRAGIPQIPKLHLAMHLAHRTAALTCRPDRRSEEGPGSSAPARSRVRLPRASLRLRTQTVPRAAGAPCTAPRSTTRRSSTNLKTARPETSQQSCTGPPGPAASSSFGRGAAVASSARWRTLDPAAGMREKKTEGACKFGCSGAVRCRSHCLPLASQAGAPTPDACFLLHADPGHVRPPRSSFWLKRRPAWVLILDNARSGVLK